MVTCGIATTLTGTSWIPDDEPGSLVKYSAKYIDKAQQTCPNGSLTTTYYSWVVTGPGGVTHQLPTADYVDSLGCLSSDDVWHKAAPWMKDAAAESGTTFQIVGGDGKPATLIQMLGDLNGTGGRYEYIVNQAGELTHQMFVKGGAITEFRYSHDSKTNSATFAL